jgi:hypothetical protein
MLLSTYLLVLALPKTGSKKCLLYCDLKCFVWLIILSVLCSYPSLCLSSFCSPHTYCAFLFSSPPCWWFITDFYTFHSSLYILTTFSNPLTRQGRDVYGVLCAMLLFVFLRVDWALELCVRGNLLWEKCLVSVNLILKVTWEVCNEFWNTVVPKSSISYQKRWIFCMAVL